MMKMNWKVMVSSRNRKYVSRSMMIKSKEHHHERANLDHCEDDDSETCSEGLH